MTGAIAPRLPLHWRCEIDLGTRECWPGWRGFLENVHRTGLQLGGDCWVAGGALLRAYTGETHNDLDVWCSTQEAHDRARAQLASLNPRPVDERDLILWTQPSETRFGTFYWMPGGSGPRIQLMRPLEASVRECINGFDLTVCQLGWDGSTLHCGPLTTVDLPDRRIRFNRRNERPQRVLDRLSKYSARGFRCDFATAASLIEAPIEGYEYDD